MKVGYVAPMSISAVNGGLRTQAMFTTEHIKELGVEPYLLSPWDDIQHLELDLVHIFGASLENTGIITQINALNIPVALSPVFFSNRKASIINKTIKFEKIWSVLGSGIRSDFSIKANMCSLADRIFPNTSDEAYLIENGFSIPKGKIQVIPNGVEGRFSEAAPKLFEQKYGIQDFVLFVGHAGAPRKNVDKLLKIAPDINVPVVIIGSLPGDNYGNKCKQLAQDSNNVTMIETLDHNSDLLASAYAASKVFVLPSQYETPGIAALEAGLAGAQIVITEKGGTKDYFLDHAEYINPNSGTSLLTGILNALQKTSSNELKEHILANYTWDKIAKSTYEQYKKLLK